MMSPSAWSFSSDPRCGIVGSTTRRAAIRSISYSRKTWYSSCATSLSTMCWRPRRCASSAKLCNCATAVASPGTSSTRRMSTEPQPSILLVEDDLRLADLVSRYLTNQGFNMAIVTRGDEVVERVQRDNPDLLILDLGLPGEDGFSICKRLRPAYTNPILILTARDNDIDHVLGLELGADDYVIKPVEPRVLLARVAVLLRRNRPSAVPVAGKVLTFGRLAVNVVSRAVKWDGRDVPLSRNEFDLL